MKKFLNLAAKAWAKATLNIQKFANAYVDAVSEFGDEAIEKFMVAFPMFGEREWRRLTLIGNGELLPQFFFKSDYFVGRLLKLNSSMRVQKALVGASNDGRIRVDRGNGPEKVALVDLTAKEDKALVMLLSEENEKLSPEELKTKYRILISKINKSDRGHRCTWEIRLSKHGGYIAHFNRGCNLDEGDLKSIIETLRMCRKIHGDKHRSASDILKEMVSAVKELEDLRDSERAFADDLGTDSSFWNKAEKEKHQWIMDSIQACRENVRRLAREATGDDKLEI